MDPAYISALSALAGSGIGGLTTGLSAWLSQRAQARAGLIAHDLARREDLVRDFIIAAAKAYGDALANNEPKIAELVDLYALISRMRALSMTRTVTRADALMEIIVETYLAPNKTVRDLHEMVKRGEGIDPLREFSETAREELREAGRL
jgi:hypothetical protein